MTKKMITVSFTAPDRDESVVAKATKADPEIRVTLEGDRVTFAVLSPETHDGIPAREMFLKYAATFRALLPESARIASVGPDRMDGQKVGKSLGLNPTAMSAGGVEIFRRYSATPLSVFLLLRELRKSGQKIQIDPELSEDLAIACDAHKINCQIARGMQERLMAEGEALMSVFQKEGIQSLRIIEEGHMASVIGTFEDAEGDPFIIVSEGDDIRIKGGDLSLGPEQISLISSITTIASEMVREERERFDAELSEWAEPRVVSRNGESVVLLGAWDGSEIFFKPGEDGSVFSENVPFSFHPEINRPDIFMKIFGEGALRMVHDIDRHLEGIEP